MVFHVECEGVILEKMIDLELMGLMGCSRLKLK